MGDTGKPAGAQTQPPDSEGIFDSGPELHGECDKSDRPPKANGLRDRSSKAMTQVARQIESEIVPRLMLALKQHSSQPKPASIKMPAIVGADVDEFVRLLLSHDDAIATSFVDALRDRGVTVKAIYLDLLTPAARQLGDMWVADSIDFVNVTLGLGRLQQVLHDLSRNFNPQAGTYDPSRRALLACAPGEQHTFGLLMVTEFMRHEGWDVTVHSTMSYDDIVDSVSNDWYAVVGLSLSCDATADRVADVIRDLRSESQNKSLGIMVGGRKFLDDPAFAEKVGADAVGADGAQAAAEAERLLDLRQKHC